jgi:LmbE family N-acetylglucosaminyl deacetylase
MATVVSFHAHPDDEVTSTGGTLARAADQGHRVVLVVATGGEHGESPDDLGPGETLTSRRAGELATSAEILGIARVVWLGYVDSGMQGWEQNDHADSFARADVDEAANRLAAILVEEQADVLITYDWHGNYGHPDHVQVHRVGHRAAELAGTPAIYEATMNRDLLVRMVEHARQAGVAPEEDRDVSAGDDGNPLGTPESELTTKVDVNSYLDRKRAALQAHASQVSDSSFFLSMDPGLFAEIFGTEWFIHVGVSPPVSESWLSGL